MEKFPLKVDLSNFFNNIYEKVMILVDSQWGNVSKAEKQLKKMFKIDCAIGFKNEEGFYIPSEEPIEILKHVHFLVAFNKSSTYDSKLHNQSDKVEQELPCSKPVDTFAAPESVRKRKRHRKLVNEAIFATSTPTVNLAKRLKSVESLDPVSTSCQDVIQIPKRDTFSTGKNPSAHITEATKSNVNRFSNASQKNITQQKQQKNARDSNKPNSHIYYNDLNEQHISNDDIQPENNKKEIIFSCNLAESTQKKVRHFRVGMETKLDDNEKVKESQSPEKVKELQSTESITILENITLVHERSKPIDNGFEEKDKSQSKEFNPQETNPRPVETEKINDSNTAEKSEIESSQLSQFTESLISCDESAVIELNESENANSMIDSLQEPSSFPSGKPSKDSTQQFIEGILSRASDLKDLPCVGDVLVFKLKLINGIISDIFVGKCEYINKRTKALKLHLIDGLSQIPLIPKKFASNLDDSIDLRNLNIKTVDMVEPKVARS